MRHPVSLLVDRFGNHGALGVLVLGTVFAGAAFDSNIGFAAAAVGAVVLAVSAPEALLEPGEDDGELAPVRSAYVDGEITLSEFEDRVEILLDDRAGEIRDVVEEVSGIGPATSATLALRYSSVEDLRAAVEDGEVERVNGVGPGRAEALAERLGGRPP